MWTVKNSVGRLVEAEITRLGPGEMQAFVAGIVAAVDHSSLPVVGIMDMSRVRVFAPEDATLLLEVMRRDNPRVERTAIIINGEVLFTMQMERLLLHSGSRARRLFKSLDDAISWLNEVFTPEEAARARELRALALLSGTRS